MARIRIAVLSLFVAIAFVAIAIANASTASASAASATSPRIFHHHASTVRVMETHARPIVVSDDAAAALSAASSVVTPQHVRIEYHEVDTHPDLVIDVPHPRFSWQLDDEPTSMSTATRSIHQVAYCITVQPRTSARAGLTHDLWNSTRVLSATSLHVPYTGPALVSDTFYVWTLQYWSSTGAVSSIATGVFRTALFNPATDFQGVWIGSKQIRMNQLRKEFTLPAGATVSQATIFYSGIGYSELWVNGALVDPTRKLDPGWTTFEKRTLYVSFDLTSLLQPGTTNSLGVHLGNGWYSQEQYSAGQAEPSYGPPRLLLQLNILLSNGNTLNITSDTTTWLGRQGEIMHDGVYHGEIYDSLAVRTGWSLPNFTDPLSVWIAPSQLPSPLDSDGILSLQSMDPIRVGADALHVKTSASRTGHDGRIAGVSGAPITQTTLTPIAEVSCGSVPVLDIGQNFAGWCRIPFQGSSDVSVYMRHSEVLNHAGPSGNSFNSLYLDNLRNAANTDIYVNHGDRFTSQTYEPTFTVRGFRYMSMLGLQNSIAMQDVQCFPVHSETTLIGNFTTTNTIINQLQHNIQWSQISNLMSLPSDCPQRDERKGWMGDAALSVDEALYNFDLAPFYENFLNLISDAQQSDGSLPDTVPLTFGQYPADPNWGTAYPTLAWTVYQHYGDVSLLKTHYAGLTAYIENLRSQYKSAGGLVHMPYRYGDWVPPPPHAMANQQLVSSYPFLHDVRIVAQIATIVGDNATAAEYTQLYANLTTEFHKTFYNATSQSYADGYQTSNVLALASPGVVPDDVKPAVLQALVNDIEANNIHVTTGIIGTSQIFTVLSDNGHHDISLALLSSTSYPSYGWTFNNEWENATTLWELWDTPLEGPDMNSRNHIMFGSVGSYFYTHLAGIQLNALETISIHPRMALDNVHLMDSCQAEVHTIKGAVLVDWSRDDSGIGSTTSSPRTLTMSVTVPPNTRATVTFDALARVGEYQALHDGEKALWDRSMVSDKSATGVSMVETLDSGALRAHIESGSYSFVAKWL